MRMTQFTKDFLKGVLIWGILFGIVYVFVMSKVLESQVEEMATTADITPLYFTMVLSTLTSSLFGLFVSWFVIGRVVKGGCIDVPADFNKWLYKYAVIMILIMALFTIYDATQYKEKATNLEKALSILSHESNNMLRLYQDVEKFLDNYLLYSFGTFAASSVFIVATLPVLRRKYESS